MAKFRQHNLSTAYANGVDAALEQLANDGMGFPQVASDATVEERSDFFRAYHDTLNEAKQK